PPAEDTAQHQELVEPQAEEPVSEPDTPEQQRSMAPQSGEATTGNADENEALVTTQAVTRDVTITVLDWDDNPIPGASVTVVGYTTSTIAASGTTGPSGTF